MINCYTSPNGDTLYFDCENSWRLHRLDGPAIEYANGDKSWYINDQHHREAGPAIDFANGYKEYWLNDKRIYCDSQEEFLRLIKMKAFW